MTEVVGLRFVTAGETEARQAMERYERAQQRLATGIQTTVQQSRQQTASLSRVVQATQRVEREIQRLTQANVQGRITSGQFQGELNRLAARLRNMGLERAQQQVMQYARASQTAARSTQALAASQAQNVAAQRNVQTATRQTTDLTGRLRTQFLATANTIAILDGPLGGIASRFSAFGVLLGRTGLLLGGVAVAATAFFTIVGRGIRNFVEWEAQTARVNAVLSATGRAALITGEQINQMASRIALATLESEQGVQQAALRLATFRDVATDMFEDILRSAADMAAAGFGTVESEAVRLAKALEDPRQALTSLSRAGIVFTRQQRAMIVSLIESGDRLRAMELILANVDRRVGGTAEAAARDTYAGAWDTIRQAIGRATREIGQFILTDTMLGRMLLGTAALLEDYARGSATQEEQIRSTEQRVQAYSRQIELLNRELETNNLLVGAQRQQAEALIRSFERSRREAQARLADLREEATATENVTRLEAMRAQGRRRMEGVENLRAEVDLRRAALGLTEEELRVRRMMGDEGVLGIDARQAVRELAERLQEGGASAQAISRAVERLEADLRSVAQAGEDLFQAFQQEQMSREVRRAADSMEQQNAVIQQQLFYMRQGMDATEARRRAEETLLLVQAAQLAAMDPANARLQEMADKLSLSVAEARRLAEEMDAVTRAAQMRRELEDTLEGLIEQRDVLDAQLILLEQGVDFTIAQRLAEIEVARARVETLMITEGVTDELRKQLALLNAMSEVTIEIGERETRVAAFRPRRGGGGRSRREDPTLEGVTGELRQQIDRQIELLQLRGQERDVLETFFDIYDRLKDSAANYTEEQLMNAAREIQARQDVQDALERQRQLQEQIADSLTTLFMSATEGAESFKRALAGLLRQLAQMLANRAFMQIMGGFSLPFMAPIPSANGNVFSGGGLVPFALGGVVANVNGRPGANAVPFADGGVVGGPTLFPMAQGRTGLMGEAGPEAIMPLRRGRGGKLGVAAEPQQVSVDVRVHMDENGDWQARVERIADGRVARAAPQIIGQSVASTYAASTERKFR